MSISAQIAANLPYLRRYARALTGSQESGDKFVRATLEAALADEALKASMAEGRLPLYRAFTAVWRSATFGTSDTNIASGLHESNAQARLSSITPLNRQALLLTTLEEFQPHQVGEILGVSGEEVNTLVEEAITEIDREASASVLIIEDEPLISMQLEDLVKSLGHEVFATAATRTQAQEAVYNGKPGLVLADIQLADGSSGLDAVDDILKLGDVPVVFITAYPERLLTGDRPEPTYLVTKPFREQTVRSTISQALFFNSSKPIS
ncbi:MAG: response regulator [Proteobacteria bacterium]|nr:response regulator [Pseudomonadota bacterium]MDA0914746.1 response regulator [Pseudomonadota bacterium]MDA1033675.1 response regulator [Pseudomonadota bacterium]